MGVSTDAILFFGLPFDSDKDETPFEGFEEFVEEALNIKRADYESYAVYSAALQEACGNCEWDYHCHCDYPQLYIYHKNSRSVAWRGDPRSFSAALPIAKPEWTTDIKNFLSRLKIDIDDTRIGWYLASVWM